MRINKLQVENFRVFAKSEIQLINSPILVVFDDNGVGKTSLHEAILWGLCGEIYRYLDAKVKTDFGTIDSLYSLRGNENGRIVITTELVTDGGILKISINRPRRRKTFLTPSQLRKGTDLQYFINDVEYNKQEFENQITALLNTPPQIFQLTNYLSQELVNETLVRDSNARGEIFSHLLSFGWMQDIYSVINEEVSTLRKIQKKYRAELVHEELKLVESELTRLWNNVNQRVHEFKERGMKFRNSDKVSFLDILDRYLEVSRLIGDEDAVQETSKQIESYTGGTPTDEVLNELTKRIDTQIGKLQAEIGKLKVISDGKQFSIQQLLNKVKTYYGLVPELKTINNQVRELESQNEKLGKELGQIEQKVESIENDLEQWVMLKKSLPDTIPSDSGISVQFLTKQKKVLEEKITKFESYLDELHDIEETVTGIEKTISILEKRKREIETELVNNELVPETDVYSQLDQAAKLIEGVVPIETDVQTKTGTEFYTEVIGIAQSALDDLNTIDTKAINEDIESLTKKITLQKSAEKQNELVNKQLEHLQKRLNEDEEKMKPIQESLELSRSRRQSVEKSRSKSPLLVGTSGISLLIGFVLLNPIFPLGIFFLLLAIILPLPVVYPSPFIERGIFLEFVPQANLLSLIDDEIEKLEDKVKNIEDRIREYSLKIEEEKLKIHQLDGDVDNYEEKITQKQNLLNSISPCKQLLSKIVISCQNSMKHLQLQEELTQLHKEINLKRGEVKEKIKGITVEEKQEPTLTQITKEKTRVLQQIDKARHDLNTLTLLLKKYVDSKVSISSEDEEKKNRENLKNLLETIDALKLKRKEILDQIQTLEKESKNKSKKIDKLREEIEEKLTILEIDPKKIEWKEETIEKEISSKILDIKKRLEEKESLEVKCNTLRNEFLELTSYMRIYSLLEKEWKKNQLSIQEAENKIQLILQKIHNAEELEAAWKEVNDKIKGKIDGFSTSIIDSIKENFRSYFSQLGGHSYLTYYDLDIRMLRGKLEVKLSVGKTKKNAGSPRALYSNGQQVSLIHSLFFAMVNLILQNNPVRYVGLDEPTQYFDTDHKIRFGNFLTEYVEKFGNDIQMILTTADREFVQILDEMNSQHIRIVKIEELLNPEFSSIQGSVDLGEKIISIRELEPEIEAEEELVLPGIETPKPRSLSSIPIIDETEGKEFTCNICFQKFNSYRFQQVCNNKDCIAEYRRSMLGD